ncbi:MAG TPA: hypothetical protein PLX02_03280 [Syntrophorhabdaceae bacterium]|nr:hypothetical protein [Syntrophorhabdaceae bacterium]HQM80621.1 hypothetical protein [Syntrophorhabdaceae bacterium]
MTTLNNVIVLRTAERLTIDAAPEDLPDRTLSGGGEPDLIAKVRKVLDEMEEEWEMDHASVELRDKFHLLRYYLQNI